MEAFRTGLSRRALGLVLVLTTLLSGCTSAPSPEPVFPDPVPAFHLHWLHALHAAPEVRFETDHGTIRLLLYTVPMPQTAGRFGALVDAGFYDGTLIHRVVDDFVIQGGDPSGTGVLGSGETIPHEVHPELLFGAGALGLARDIDPDSGDSQWYITERPAPHLSDPGRSSAGSVFGAFALFGQVFEGMDVVRRIAATSVVPVLDRPVDDVTLRTATLLPPPTDLDLLQYPPTLRVEDATAVRLMRPLHPVAEHPLAVAVFVGGTAPPPPSFSVRYLLHEGTNATVVDVDLAPLPDDPRVFQGHVVLPSAGTWYEVLPGPGGGGSVTIEVLPAHADHERYVRGTAGRAYV